MRRQGSSAVASADARGPTKSRVLLVCLLLAAATLVIYGQVRHHEFVNYDDLDDIVDNPYVRGGLLWENVKWVFTHAYSANWVPLSWISHMLDFQLFGGDPGGHHMVNVVIHASSAIVLFLALYSMTGALWRSAVVAALFAVHPLRVESVAWAAERKDVLSALFWMLTLLAYGCYARRPAVGRYLLVVALFALGLMAKPMLVTLPFVLLLLDYWPLRRWSPTGGGTHARFAAARPLLLEKVPLLLLSGAVSVVTMITQRSAGAFYALPLGERAANGILAYAIYLGKTIWPARLSVFYPHPTESRAVATSAWFALALGAAVLLAMITALAARQARKRPYLLVGWLWYLGTLVPVLGLVQVGRQALADRYTYVPLVGVYVAVAWGLHDLARRWNAGRIVLREATAVVLLLLMIVSFRQVAVWRTSVTLFEHALRVTRSNYVAHNNLGTAFLRRGDSARAASHFEKALRIEPDFADAHANLGALLSKTDRTALALQHLQDAIRIQPLHAGAHYNLGRLLMLQGDAEGAAEQFEIAIRARPHDAESHTSLGVVYARRGDYDRAEEHFRQAIRFRPEHVSALMNLGRLLSMKGEREQAAVYFERARGITGEESVKPMP